MRVPLFTGQSALVHAIPSPEVNMFSLDVSLKPNTSDADVLLVTSQQQMDHYIILLLQDGRLTLTVSFNGSTASLPHSVFIADNEWRVVSLAISNRFMELTVGEAPEQTRIPSSDIQFVFDGAVHLGGAALCGDRPCPLLMGSAGYVGCMRDLQINLVPLDIVSDALQGANVAQCPVAACSTVVCQNGGVCVGISSVNFTCDCLEGFGGRFCEVRLDVCSPSPCLFGGVCVANGTAFYCACALGRAGQRCEIGEVHTTPTSLCATPTSLCATPTSLCATPTSLCVTQYTHITSCHTHIICAMPTSFMPHPHHLCHTHIIRAIPTSFVPHPHHLCDTHIICATPTSFVPHPHHSCHTHIICVTPTS